MANVKGFAPWNPRGEYQELTDQVLETIEHFRKLWPLTQRSWLYRLMGRHGWKKEWETYSPSQAQVRLASGKRSDKGDGGLNLILNRGRRAGIIPWEAVASKRGTRIEPVHYTDALDMAHTAVESIAFRRVNRQSSQARLLGLWVETDGMVPMFEALATKYTMPLTSGSGFDTTGAKYDFAISIAEMRVPVHMLHIGDCDDSGERIHRALVEDIASFTATLGGEFALDRIAVTDQQIDEYGLYWEPQKDDRSNHRIGDGRERWAQAEAMEPDDMIELVEAAIVERLDMGKYFDAVQQEREYQKVAKAALEPALKKLG